MALIWPFRLDSRYDILIRVLNLYALDIGFFMGPMWGIYRIRLSRSGPGGGTAIYGLYRYVPL